MRQRNLVVLSCSYDRTRIEDAFNLNAADLQLGIESYDIDQVEWSLAPVIFSCSEANERAVRRLRLQRFTALVSLVVYALIAAVFLGNLFLSTP